MSSSVVMAPTPEILEAGELLEKVIGGYLDFRGTTWSHKPDSGKWEAEIEAFNLMNLAIRHVEAIVELSRVDLVLIPSAMTIARTLFETAVRGMWIMTPLDPFDREVRWLAQLKGEEEYLGRLAKETHEMSSDHSEIDQWRISLHEFRIEVEGRLPVGYKPPKSLPNLKEMLKDIGVQGWYPVYVELSQYTHSSHKATQLYRKNLGVHKVLGEFTTAHSWWPCFKVCWVCLVSFGRLTLRRISESEVSFFSSEASTSRRMEFLLDRISGTDADRF